MKTLNNLTASIIRKGRRIYFKGTTTEKEKGFVNVPVKTKRGIRYARYN